ncbi:MAG: zinc-binding dehydrogenase [Candidatus Dormibacteraceae bacterium]
MRAIVALRRGGPEVMELREQPDPVPAPGQVLIRVASAGVNFADVHSIGGHYAAAPEPPFIPGLEVAGTDPQGRPVTALVTSGGYAELVAADAALVFPAAGDDLSRAGGDLLVTLTSYFALAEAARLRPGESVLVTAAAGGLGSTCIQVARALGAGRVIGMASTPEKRRLALEQGADEAIGYQDPIPAVDVAVESVGGEVFDRCLAAVRPLGRIIPLGASSGEPPSVADWDGLRRRNVIVAPISFGMYRRNHPELVAAQAGPAIEMLRSGRVRPPVSRGLPLVEAELAHRLLTSRQTTGKLLLVPDPEQTTPIR